MNPQKQLKFPFFDNVFESIQKSKYFYYDFQIITFFCKQKASLHHSGANELLWKHGVHHKILRHSGYVLI